MLWETVLKTLLKSRETTSTAFLSSTRQVTWSKKETRLVKQDPLLTNPCCLGLMSWLSCMCCMMALKRICSIIFPWEYSLAQWESWGSRMQIWHSESSQKKFYFVATSHPHWPVIHCMARLSRPAERALSHCHCVLQSFLGDCSFCRKIQTVNTDTVKSPSSLKRGHIPT